MPSPFTSAVSAEEATAPEGGVLLGSPSLSAGPEVHLFAVSLLSVAKFEVLQFGGLYSRRLCSNC